MNEIAHHKKRRTCLQKDDSIGKYSSRPLVIVNNAGDFYFMLKYISNFLHYVILATS